MDKNYPAPVTGPVVCSFGCVLFGAIQPTRKLNPDILGKDRRWCIPFDCGRL